MSFMSEATCGSILVPFSPSLEMIARHARFALGEAEDKRIAEKFKFATWKVELPGQYIQTHPVIGETVAVTVVAKLPPKIAAVRATAVTAHPQGPKVEYALVLLAETGEVPREALDRVIDRAVAEGGTVSGADAAAVVATLEPLAERTLQLNVPASGMQSACQVILAVRPADAAVHFAWARWSGLTILAGQPLSNADLFEAATSRETAFEEGEPGTAEPRGSPDELAVDKGVQPGNQPAIAIIVPTHCSASYLEECLTSVRSQTFGNFECIIVDDCSPEDELSIALRIAEADSRFKVVRHTAKGGASAARNTGLKLARGEFVLFLDADDVLLPRALEWQHDMAVRFGADVVRTSGEVWYGRGRTNMVHQKVGIFCSRAEIESNQWLYASSQLQGTLIRRAPLREHGIEFDCDLILGEDIDFLSRAKQTCKSAAVAPLITFLYRKGHKSLSNRLHYSEEQWLSFGRYQTKLSRSHADRPRIRAFFFLNHVEWNARHIARLLTVAPQKLSDEVLNEITQAHSGLTADLAWSTTEQPWQTPIEIEPFLRALFAHLVEQRPEAVKRLMEELMLGPYRDELLEVETAWLEGSFERAAELTRQAYERQPWHPEFALAYGRVLQQDGNKKAKELLLYALPRSVQLFSATYAACAAFGSGQIVIDILRGALTRLPNSPGLLNRLAVAYDRMGDLVNRVAALQQAALYAPRDPIQRERLIDGLLDLDGKDAAAREIESFRTTGGNEWYERQLAKLDGKSGDLEKALRRIGSVVCETGEFDLAALQTQADILLQMGNTGAAIPPLRSAANHECGDVQLRTKLADACRRHGDIEGALAVLSDLVALNDWRGCNLQTHKSVFALLVESGRAKEAAGFLHRYCDALIRKPDMLASFLWIGRDAGRQNEILQSEMERALELALAEQPSHAPLLMMQVRFDLNRGRLKLALERAGALVADAPDQADRNALLGQCLAMNQEYLLASEAYEAASRLEHHAREYFASQAKRFRELAEKQVSKVPVG